MLKGYTKEEKAWMMYDWANSSQSVIIVTLLPVFYQTINASNPSAASYWGYSTSIAMLIIALLSPILGALGDFKDNKKKILKQFLIVGVMSCLLLAITPLLDAQSFGSLATVMIIVCYIVSQIGHSGANVMYDSMLLDVTTEERMDKVSTMGFGLGYIGGSTIPLVIFLGLAAIIPMNHALSIVFLITGIWWWFFSIPLFKHVKQYHYKERKKGALKESLYSLQKTLKEIYNNKEMFIFLLAYFFYIDGVNTIIHMSTIYGASLGIDATQMLLALLLTQVLGLPFAMIYVKLSEKLGTRFMICTGICVYMYICVFGYMITTAAHFWVLACFVGTSQGGIQALSRSYFGKMIPDKSRSGEFFGFYDIFGKFSAILGPFVFAFTAEIYRNYLMKKWELDPENLTLEMADKLAKESNPYGVLSILGIFVIGAVLFMIVLPRFKKKNGDLYAR